MYRYNRCKGNPKYTGDRSNHQNTRQIINTFYKMLPTSLACLLKEETIVRPSYLGQYNCSILKCTPFILYSICIKEHHFLYVSAFFCLCWLKKIVLRTISQSNIQCSCFRPNKRVGWSKNYLSRNFQIQSFTKLHEYSQFA